MSGILFKLLLKHVPTQAEPQAHRTAPAPCDDSSGLQAFQKDAASGGIEWCRSVTGLHEEYPY